VITITNPASGPVTGVVNVTANATSSAGIASVQFKLNGGNLGAVQTGNGPNYSISWDTTGLTGSQTLTAVAIDKNASPLSTTSLAVNVVVATNTPAGSFIRTDTATQGNWKGVYGADGRIIPNDPSLPAGSSSLPNYVTVTGPGPNGAAYSWPQTT